MSSDTSSDFLKSLKWYKRLTTKKARVEEQVFLVEGYRSVSQIASNNPQEILEILTVDELPAQFSGYPVRFITDAQLRSLSLSITPQGPLAVVRVPAELYSGNLPKLPGRKLLLFEDIQDPGNVGTLIRTAAAFDFSGIILTTKCADPLSPKSVQSSAGSVLSLWLRVTENYLEMVSKLKQAGYSIIATDLKGKDNISSLCHIDALLLALGNEAAGLSEQVLNISDYRIKIPITGKTESLNVAACGAICMYLSS